tara:strand:+ start:664 stop:1131 length:468 start_codon:yes stop_codon:yes gene_type:complete
MAESQDTESQQEAEPLQEKVVAQLSEIAALLSLSVEQYQQQMRLTRQTARAEMALSRRSMMVVAALLVAITGAAIILWATLLVFAGYWLMHATNSVPLTASILIVVQLAVLYWCWRSVRYVLAQVGFSHTLAQLKDMFRLSAEPAGGSNVNQSVD